VLDDFTAYFDDLRFYLQMVAVIPMFQAIVLTVVGALIITRLTQMVEIANKNGKQAAWRDSQTFKPTPNQPYPPRGQQRG
jgi:hypothetical protein